MTSTHKLFVFALVLLFGLILSACGGDGNNDTNATSNQWDKMSWDQGEWG